MCVCILVCTPVYAFLCVCTCFCVCARVFNTPLYLAFVDLRKAYDSVNRDTLWMVLQRRYHLPIKLVHILRALHKGTRGAVRAYGGVSGEFDVTMGVRQGDVLAPTLFNLFFDSVISATLARHPHCGIKILYNLGDELVGSRKMRGSVMIQYWSMRTIWL